MQMTQQMKLPQKRQQSRRGKTMNMKLKKSDVNILIMLLGILIPVAIYFFVYTSFT